MKYGFTYRKIDGFSSEVIPKNIILKRGMGLKQGFKIVGYNV